MKKDISEDSLAFSHWRKKNLFRILTAGIPEHIAENHRDWLYVLQHAEHFPSGWKLDWISPEEMRLLHDLLISAGNTQTGDVLIQELERRLK